MSEENSSQSLRRWEDDGGPPPLPQRAPDPGRSDRIRPPRLKSFCDDPDFAAAERPEETRLIDLVVLPFTEYTSRFRDRIDGLRGRLMSFEPASVTRFVVTDTSRVLRPSVCLIGILHAAAGFHRRHGRELVIVGDLTGMLKITRLNEVCPLFGDREAAMLYCRNRLDFGDNAAAVN